jgi:large exoprotein involved in heme utilization and adhesion
VSGQACVENICTAGKPTGPADLDGGNGGTADGGKPKPNPDGGVKVDGGVIDAGDPCAGKTLYRNALASRASQWAYNNLVGMAAANAECKAQGADHFCDYEEIKAAAAKGELAGVANGTTVWVHRTTAAVVGGISNPGGGGARCDDWTYGSNHLNQGEFATINGGQPTFDLAPGDQLGVGFAPSGASARKCGTVVRSILCCNVKCTP